MTILECIRSLAIENQESRERSIDLVPGTCKWIESHPIFRTWEGSRTGTLWIRGQPGSGKSSLMKYLTDALDCETPNTASPVVASFFFHGTGLEVQRSLFGFYSALLNQLLQEIPQFCHEIFEKFTKGRSTLGDKFKWEMQELRDFLSSIIFKATSTGFPIIILADALDEAGQSNAMELMQFFRAIENTAKKTTGGIHCSLRICFSCRSYPIIVGQEHEFIIEVDLHNAEDLSVFVRHKLKPDQSVGIQDNILTKVQDDIIRKTGRTFQWANLMIKEVGKMFTEMDTMLEIQEQISRTPSDLYQFYRQLISPKILGDNGATKQNMREQALTLELFQWLCFSKEPPTLATIQHALLLGPEEPHIAKISEHRDFQSLKAVAVKITKLSKGLVEIRGQISNPKNSEEIVQFIHQSVYEFLMETGLADLTGSEIAGLEPTSRAMKVTGLGHFQISRACIQAMDLEDTRIFNERHRPLMIEHPEGWALNSSPKSVSKLPSCCYSFGLTADLVDQWSSPTVLTTAEISAWISQTPSGRKRGSVRFQSSMSQHSKQMIPVAFYGSKYLCYHLEAVENCGWDQSDIPDFFNGTSLMDTWRDTARLGWRMMAPSSLIEGSPITHVLAECGITSALRFFLRHDPRSCSTEDAEGQSPLHCAIKYGKNGVIELLMQEALERGCIDIDISDGRGETPLHYAIKHGREKAAQMLIREALNHGTVTINRPETFHGRTPLHHAIEYDRRKVVQTLIQAALDRRVVDVDCPDHQGRTPIFYAARYERVDGMRHLLSTGMVHVDRQDWAGGTPLAAVALSGCTENASLLLEYGASVDSKDKKGRTPLFLAVRWSNLEMTRFLVEKAHAEVDLLDNAGRGVLSYAAEGGNAPKTEYIFAIVPKQSKIEDKVGKLPITYAFERQRRGAAFNFLKRHTGQHEESPLIIIALYGQCDVVEYILEHEGPFSLEMLKRVLQVAQRLKRGIREKIEKKIAQQN